MGKTKKKNLRGGADKPYPNLGDQIVSDRLVSSKKNKEPKIRLRQDEREEVNTIVFLSLFLGWTDFEI